MARTTGAWKEVEVSSTHRKEIRGGGVGTHGNKQAPGRVVVAAAIWSLMGEVVDGLKVLVVVRWLSGGGGGFGRPTGH